jgi:hypothetical protein
MHTAAFDCGIKIKFGEIVDICAQVGYTAPREKWVQNSNELGNEEGGEV